MRVEISMNLFSVIFSIEVSSDILQFYDLWRSQRQTAANRSDRRQIWSLELRIMPMCREELMVLERCWTLGCGEASLVSGLCRGDERTNWLWLSLRILCQSFQSDGLWTTHMKAAGIYGKRSSAGPDARTRPLAPRRRAPPSLISDLYMRFCSAFPNSQRWKDQKDPKNT